MTVETYEDTQGSMLYKSEMRERMKNYKKLLKNFTTKNKMKMKSWKNA